MVRRALERPSAPARATTLETGPDRLHCTSNGPLNRTHAKTLLTLVLCASSGVRTHYDHSNAMHNAPHAHAPARAHANAHALGHAHAHAHALPSLSSARGGTTRPLTHSPLTHNHHQHAPARTRKVRPHQHRTSLAPVHSQSIPLSTTTQRPPPTAPHQTRTHASPRHDPPSPPSDSAGETPGNETSLTRRKATLTETLIRPSSTSTSYKAFS